ncbi:MAG: hypothetical protein M3437_18295 [Chloroflexota bacterium]|nr:hypothetical protein [Chloroflexota bacterium]MDQ5864158.1 hypothetical protein [Chloroflexota bacterium]
MNTTPEDWVSRYQTQQHVYEHFVGQLKELVHLLLKANDIEARLEARVKSLTSFKEKLSRPGKTYDNPLSDITDLAGLRVITRTLDEADQAAALLRREFKIDEHNSVNKLDQLEPDRFGYLSQHYIIRLNENRSSLSEWNHFAELCAEVQVRTILQHAWSQVQYPLDYKSSIDVPKELRRRLFRLSALFELADQELSAITAQSSELTAYYASHVEADSSAIDLNLDSLRAYLEHSTTVKYWADYLTSLGPTLTDIGAASRDVAMAHRVGIQSIAQLDNLLEASKSWGKQYLAQSISNVVVDFAETHGLPPSSDAISIDRNGIVTIFLIGNYPDVFNEVVLNDEYGFGHPERFTIPARHFNPRFLHSEPGT